MHTPAILTIGYGERSFEEFTRLLKTLAVTVLVDVRSQPYSRYKPEFSREALEGKLQAEGIRYVFLGGELGGRPEDESCYVNGRVDYLKVREKPWFRKGISRLQKAASQKQQIILMCSEGKPEACHRSKLIGKALVDAGLPVTHIDEEGKGRTHDEVVLRMTGGQGTLFEDAPVTSTSRKTYGPAKLGE